MEKMEGAATMADDKVSLATFKIYPEDADWAAAEQRRLKREERRAVTQADLFSRLRARYLGAGEEEGREGGRQAAAEGAGSIVLEALGRIEAALKGLKDERARNPRSEEDDAGAAAVLALVGEIEKSTRETAESNRRTTKALELLQRRTQSPAKRRGHGTT